LDTKKLHILFLTSWFPSRVFPVLGDFIQRHAEAVATLHQVSLVHVISDPNLKHRIELEFKVQNGIEIHIAYIPFSDSLFCKTIWYLKAYHQIFKKIGSFDLIHLNKLYASGLVALYFKIFKGKKYLITEHWSGYQKINNSNIGKIEKWVSRLITNQASYICPVTQHLAKSMIEFGLKGNYFPVPNVVNTELFVPNTHQNDTLTLIHISSLDDSIKNISGILNVLGRLQQSNFDFKMYFLGGTMEPFEKKIKLLQLKDEQIQFIHHMPQSDMLPFLQNADAFILFSNYENLPCVILESFSCGIPVISTRVGGIEEYFPEDFGVLINPKDESALAHQILNLKSKKWADSKTMHQYANEQFSQAHIAKTYHDLYIKML
jgi:glycosyltransferase involved in cell wall biosynthesis